MVWVRGLGMVVVLVAWLRAWLEWFTMLNFSLYLGFTFGERPSINPFYYRFLLVLSGRSKKRY